jgi:predicted nuclease of predicted toxin-antitoxin system
MILLDQGLPRTTVLRLRELGLDAEHVGDVGLATADDRTILDQARRRGQIVVTLDADFHAQLALSGAPAPSVIRIRIEGLKAEQLATLLRDVLEQCGDDLKSGAMVSVAESGIRVRRLPLLPF